MQEFYLSQVHVGDYLVLGGSIYVLDKTSHTDIVESLISDLTYLPAQ